jgi:catechol 2,3-dioxygenase-like lactoylglutathione lyase family enzyme
MFSHVMVGASDLERSKRFYDAALAALGIAPGAISGERVFWRTPQGNFAITKPINGQAATFANGGTIGFACNSPDQVEAWHAAGVANGGTSCEDPPGPRQGPAVTVYLAYMRDPDGNKLCALHRPG